MTRIKTLSRRTFNQTALTGLLAFTDTTGTSNKKTPHEISQGVPPVC